MGVSFTASLVVGFPESAARNSKTVTSEVTKYDENTGTPYQKTVHTEVDYFGTTELTEDDLADEESFYERLGLNVYDAGEWDDDPVVGVRVGEADGGDVDTIEPVELDIAHGKVRDVLAAHGLRDVKVSIFLVAYVG